MKFTFVDGEKLGVYENGETTFLESTFLSRARQTALRSARSKEWKRKTDAYMEEDFFFEDDGEVYADIYAFSHTAEQNKFVYAFSVNETSGLYYKYTDDKEKTEAHLISSNEVEFTTLCVAENGQMLVSAQVSSVASNIAIFEGQNGDYKYLTGGDSLDENPSFDKDGNILFNSYGVGRDQNNAFVAYAPSEIYKFNTTTNQAEVLLGSEKYSYIKPICDKDGNIYCIRKPAVEPSDENVLLQILLIPVRIVQAIVGFVSVFVSCFARKPMIQGQSAKSLGNGGEASKNADGRKMWVQNHLLNVDKELKRNKKWSDLGFIPKTWALVKLCGVDGKFDEYTEYELAFGAADFCLLEGEEKHMIYTTGKHIFDVCDEGEGGKRKKLLDVDCCLKVNSICPYFTKNEE